jgi:predicted GIY-YIG superfamily endonuclease
MDDEINFMEKPWFVYCLATCELPVQTYIGATIDPDRRLAQHNKGCGSGGAKATSRRPGSWYRVCYVSGFPDKRSALQFEWRWKYFSRKKAQGAPLERRRQALFETIGWSGLDLVVHYPEDE